MSVDILLAADAVDAYTFSAGRVVALVAGALGLVGAIVGGLALVRSRRPDPGSARGRAVVALVAGSVAAVAGALVVITADGGLGTGNGLGGGVVAVVVGLVGVVLGGLALARSRRAAVPSP
ncbi:DUF6223 family protein [Actinosynnema sp. NPDC004786]